MQAPSALLEITHPAAWFIALINQLAFHSHPVPPHSTAANRTELQGPWSKVVLFIWM
jgi:hypothetical protein